MHLAAHMIANCPHYVNMTISLFPDSEILVVRTAELWDGLKALDEWLDAGLLFLYYLQPTIHN